MRNARLHVFPEAAKFSKSPAHDSSDHDHVISQTKKGACPHVYVQNSGMLYLFDSRQAGDERLDGRDLTVRIGS